MKNNPATHSGQGLAGYDTILADLSAVIQEAPTSAVRTVNAVMTAAYWFIGRRIVEYDQSGEERAAYGEELLVRLADDLGRSFGRGFSRPNLQQMRQFYERTALSKDKAAMLEEGQAALPEDAAVAHYALDGLPNQVMAAEYRTALPDEKELTTEIERTRALLEERRATLLEVESE